MMLHNSSRNNFFLRGVLVSLFVALSALGFAQDYVKWSVTQVEGSLKSKGSIVVEATISEGWHLYSVIDQQGPYPTTFSAEGATLGEKIEEEGLEKGFDQGFKKEINSFSKKARFKVPFTASGTPKFSVRFQICKDGTCLRPKTVELDASQAPEVPEGSVVFASANPAPGESPKATTPTSESATVEAAKKSGLFAYLQVAFLAGLTALLTPCVFPMIPITVSFFSKRKEEGSALKQALLYCAGIIGTFTGLGIVAALLFGATGLNKLANNPIVNLGLAIIFIVLALSLLGVFEIGLPSKVLNKFDGTGKTGWIAPILMGLTFSLTSFTCTLPFVGAVLLSAAQGEYFYPAIGMLAFSTAFCIPFFLLALFPQMLSKLPRSGAWMVTVKAYMGFIELIAAVKFLSTFDLGFNLGIITREFNLALWFLLLVLAGIYLLGWIRLPHVDEGKIGWLRRAFAVGTLALAMKVGLAFNGSALGDLEGFLPPSPYPGKTGGASAAWKGKFVESWDEALAKAKETGKPIFIDFTGQYCTNCRVVEQNVFPSKEVGAQFENFVNVSLYTDRNTAEDNKNAKLQQDLTRTSTLPTYAIVSPDGSRLISSRAYTNDPSEFAKWMSENAR